MINMYLYIINNLNVEIVTWHARLPKFDSFLTWESETNVLDNEIACLYSTHSNNASIEFMDIHKTKTSMDILTNHFSYESVGGSFPLTIHKYFITVDRCLILQTMWLFLFYTLTHGVQILQSCLIITTNSILVSLKQLWQTRLKKNQNFGWTPNTYSPICPKSMIDDFWLHESLTRDFGKK